MSKGELLLQKITGVLPDQVINFIGGAGEFAGTVSPYISGVMNHFRFTKIEKRLEQNEEKINKLIDKIYLKDSVFYKQEVFPIIFNKLVNEEQDEKVPILLQGFEHILDENIRDLEEIFHFYDVLEEMRISDILHLFELYNPHTNWELKVEELKSALENNDAYQKQKDIERYIKNKLVRLGLLDYKKEIERDLGHFDYNKPFEYSRSSMEDKEVWKLDEFELSNFGVRFINFFK
jgi:hypothetical protein